MQLGVAVADLSHLLRASDDPGKMTISRMALGSRVCALSELVRRAIIHGLHTSDGSSPTWSWCATLVMTWQGGARPHSHGSRLAESAYNWHHRAQLLLQLAPSPLFAAASSSPCVSRQAFAPRRIQHALRTRRWCSSCEQCTRCAARRSPEHEQSSSLLEPARRSACVVDRARRRRRGRAQALCASEGVWGGSGPKCMRVRVCVHARGLFWIEGRG